MARKFFKRALIGALLLSASLTLLLYLTDNAYIIKGVSHTYLRGKKSPGITDHALFDVRKVEATSPSALPLHGEYNQKEMTDRLSAELAKWKSVAFLVFLRDSLIHEQYWDGFSADSRTNTYSASKTVVTLAAQKAIEQGLIEGWDQKAKDHLPELKGAYADQLSLRHLSTMTAGLDWDEHYSSPFTITAKTYYTDRLEEVMLDVEIAEPPGKRHHYQSGSTQLLALCVMRATGKSLSEYVSESFWGPLGAEKDAVWHLDHEDGTEIAYCCMNTNARDFGRFGMLANHLGNWRGKQIIDSAFYPLATTPFRSDFYGHSYWVSDDRHGTKVFYMRGKDGQYVISIPDKELVIVRLGHQYDREGDPHRNCFHVYVEEVLKMYDESRP